MRIVNVRMLHFIIRCFNIHKRLNQSCVIQHPVTEGDFISAPGKDSKARFFNLCLSGALKILQPVANDQCDRKTALECWDLVFKTTFFSEICSSEKKGIDATVITSGAIISSTP